MLSRHTKLALYMESSLADLSGKMGLGMLRYSPNPIVCVLDSDFSGKDISEVTKIPRKCPIVATIDQAIDLGADALVLGIAPSGGKLPESWLPILDQSVRKGLSLVNGLHDPLSSRYPVLREGQFIWDIRSEPNDLSVGTGAACQMRAKRLLTVGTDMSVGKMTAGLELLASAQRRGLAAAFVASGQIGIAITGSGVPLDAVRLDFAAGAVEREVTRYADADLIIVEGQGSLAHPGSSATLPLVRGSCPTHLVMCVRAGQESLAKLPNIVIPELNCLSQMYQDLASCCGTFQRPRWIGTAINSGHLNSEEYRFYRNQIREDTGLPATDPLREGVDVLLDELLRD